MSSSSIDVFEESLAALLSLSKSTVIELPSPARLKTILSSQLLNKNTKEFISRYSNGQELLASVAKRVIPPIGYKHSDNSRSFITIDVVQEIANSSGTNLFKFSFGPLLLIEEQAPRISLRTLLNLGMTPKLRRKLFKLFLDFPVWKYSDAGDCKQAGIKPSNLFIELSDIRNEIEEVVSEYEIITTSLSLSYHSPCGDELYLGSTAGPGNVISDRERALLIFGRINNHLKENSEDLAEGKFSLIEQRSGYGHLSVLFAQHYPNATIVSVESSSACVDYHVNMVFGLNVSNNAVCLISERTTDSSILVKNLYESPELFRYQLHVRDILQLFIESNDASAWGQDIGMSLSLAMTTFASLPTDQQISYGVALFFGEVTAERTDGDRSSWVPFHSALSFSSHPSKEYEGFDKLLLLGLAKTKEGGSTAVNCTHIKSIDIPLIRCDILNMTRHVHHHYEYAKDGHSRTYTMHVLENNSMSQSLSLFKEQGGLVYQPTTTGIRLTPQQEDVASILLPLGAHPNRNKVIEVHLLRDKDAFPIPYTSIYGVTLITVIRMGLDARIRDLFFKEFLNLSLYEDMAPWNIVLNGPALAYIDYDTREYTYDKDISKTYQLLSVLMNYKRTIEDFKKCGSKASNLYNLPFISDCVGKDVVKGITCPDTALPVPCGDGKCHTNYISCLRALGDRATLLLSSSDLSSKQTGVLDVFDTLFRFNDGGKVEI